MAEANDTTRTSCEPCDFSNASCEQPRYPDHIYVPLSDAELRELAGCSAALSIVSDHLSSNSGLIVDSDSQEAFAMEYLTSAMDRSVSLLVRRYREALSPAA